MARKFTFTTQVYDQKTDFPATGDVDVIYIDASKNTAYRYDDSYYKISSAEVNVWGALGSVSKGGGGGGSTAWGSITGTLSSQTDLQTALDAKQNTLVSGTSIKTINSTSLLGSGNVLVQSPLIISLNADNSTAVTGTTANSIVSSILVPANTFASSGIIDIAARYLKTGTAGNQNLRMYVNTSSSLTGATLVASFYNGANTQVGAWRTANISSNTIRFLSSSGVFSSDLASIAGSGTSATFNTSVDNYIIFAVQLVSGSDSCVLQFHKVLKYA